jgi:hypothetical protein
MALHDDSAGHGERINGGIIHHIELVLVLRPARQPLTQHLNGIVRGAMLLEAQRATHARERLFAELHFLLDRNAFGDSAQPAGGDSPPKRRALPIGVIQDSMVFAILCTR